MGQSLAIRLCKRFDSLDTERMPKLKKWQEIAEYLQPERADFYGVKSASAEDRLKLFDSTPEDALQNLAAALHSLLTSAVHTFFGLSLAVGNEDITEEAKYWIDDVVKQMMAKFMDGASGFHSAVHEFYMDICSFGMGVFFVDEYDGDIRFMCIPLSEVRVSENSKGVIDTVYRKFSMTARQIEEQWPNNVPKTVQDILKTSPDRKFDILHVVEPRKTKKKNPILGKDRPFASIYVLLSDKEIINESGYYEMPYMAARWSKTAGDVYGRGIGHKVLPDLRVLNEMSRSEMIATEKAADPTTLLPHEGFVGDFSSDGGALNYYRGNGTIRDRILTLGSEADLNAIRSAIQSKQDAIRRMFLNDKLQMVGGPQMTATEVIATQTEKMRILGPVLGRFQTEFLSPLIERVYGIMMRAEQLFIPPEELESQDMKISYISPISRAQRQVEAEAFQQAMSYLAPVINVNPEVLEHFDFEAITRDTQELFGYPSKYLTSMEKLTQMRKAKAEANKKNNDIQDANIALELAGKAKGVQGEQAQAA